MRGKAGLRALLLVALLVAAVVAGLKIADPPGAPITTSPAKPITTARPASSGAVHTFSQWLDEAKVRATSKAEWAMIARRSSVVVLNSWDFRLIPVLKHANPHVQVWVYKDLSGVRSDDCTTASGKCGACRAGVRDSRFLSSGMGYCWVKRNHPNWLLRSARTGRPLEFAGYPHTWEADYGNRAYQRQWLRNVLADVRARGWDGVKVDNALTTAAAYGVAAKYRSDAVVQSATYSALRMIGPALRRAGVASVFNVGYAPKFPGLWERWLGPVGGLEQEFYLSFSTRPSAVGAAWKAYESEVSSCAAQHRRCWFHAGDYSASVTRQTRNYALASFLLATDGRQLLAVGDTASVAGMRCPALGAPLGAMREAGRAWRRNFTRGVAVVDPWSVRLPVSLGGAYADGRRNAVSAITLGPASGAVIGAARRDGCH